MSAPEKPRTLRAQMGPFVMVPAWVLELCQRRAPTAPALANAVLLYGLLSKHANRERRAWPKTENLATEMAPAGQPPVSLRTVERTIAFLRTIGALHTSRRRRPDGAVVGLDFVVVQADPRAETEQPDTGDGLLGAAGNVPAHSDTHDGMGSIQQPDTGDGLLAVHSDTRDGMAAASLPDTQVGLSGVHSDIRVAAIPTHKSESIKEELDPIELDPRTKERDLSTALPPTRTRTLLDDYHDGYVARFTTDPADPKKPAIVPGKDAKLLADLAKHIDEATIRRMLWHEGAPGWFFRTPDPFIRSTGYTVGVFVSCFNKLQLTARPAKDAMAADAQVQLLADMRARSDAKQQALEQEARAAIIAATAETRERMRRIVVDDLNHLYPGIEQRMQPEAFTRSVKIAMVRYVVDNARRSQRTPTRVVETLQKYTAA